MRLFGHMRHVAPWLLVGAIALLSVGTISNQLRINAANTRLSMQATNGQRSLARTCRLGAVSRKFYADALRRRVITADDYALFSETLEQACSNVRKVN